jgi:hypothetical protein
MADEQAPDPQPPPEPPVAAEQPAGREAVDTAWMDVESIRGSAPPGDALYLVDPEDG